MAKRPNLGPFRANAWYVKHVVSVLWHLIRPYALVLAGQGVLLAVTVFRPGHHAPNFRPELSHTFVTIAAVRAVLYGSVMPAPGVSLFDALIYFAAAYHGVQRTRLIRTGLLTAAATSFIGFAILFSAAAVITPGLVLATYDKPFIFVILSVYLLVPVTYALLMGGLAGIVGKWPAPLARRKLGASGVRAPRYGAREQHLPRPIVATDPKLIISRWQSAEIARTCSAPFV